MFWVFGRKGKEVCRFRKELFWRRLKWENCCKKDQGDADRETITDHFGHRRERVTRIRKALVGGKGKDQSSGEKNFEGSLSRRAISSTVRKKKLSEASELL